MLLECTWAKLTVDKVIETPDEKVLTASLSSPPVGIKVDVADGLPDAEAADDERFTVRVDYVHVVRVRLVQSHLDVVPFEEGARGI